MKSLSRRDFVRATLGSVGLAELGCEHARPQAGVTITGTGATFPYPLYERWVLEYARETGVVVAYKPTGSSDGIQAILTDRTDFAGTDVPMNDNELDQAGDVVHVPMTLGGVALAYNLPDGPGELKLDGETLSGIFLGDIKTWNDARIQKLNPDEKLPPTKITVLVRADGSGTTRVFTEFLSATSPAWKERVGVGAKVEWTTGYAAQHNDGVADTVARRKGTIGYVQTAFAMSRRLKVAAVRNPSGGFVLPTVEAATEAAAHSVGHLPADLRASIVNAEGGGSYPITGYSYLLVRRDALDAKRGRACAEFLWWGLHDGQRFGPSLGYGALPDAVVGKAETKLRELRFQGQKLLA